MTDKELQEILEKAKDFSIYLPKTASWVEACYNQPKNSEIILARCDELMEGYGTEAIFLDQIYWPEIAYVNLGDPYLNTILCLYDSDGSYEFKIGNWGEELERIENEK